jgi:hypothetical protein
VSHPLLTALEQAVGGLGAVALGADSERVFVGYQELELALTWAEVDAAVGGARPRAWTRALGDLVVTQAIACRSEEAEPAELRTAVLPVLWSRVHARELVARAPEVLTFAWASELLVTLAHPVAHGRRLLLRYDTPTLGEPPELLRGALANLRRRTRSDAVQALDPDEPTLFALDCADGLDSSRLLVLDDLRPDLAPTGVLAAAPARETLSFVPFTRRGCAHLRELVNLAHNGVASLPFPLTDSLFYVAPHTALAVPVTRDPAGTPRLSFPAELAQRQADLVAAGAW